MKLSLCRLPADALILQSHRMVDRRQVLGGDLKGSFSDRLVQGFSRDQHVDKRAIQGLGRAMDGVEVERTRGFTLFDGEHSGLRKAHPGAQLGSAHTECLTDAADPASRRSRKRSRAW